MFIPWNDKAWQAHCNLAKKSIRYASNSYDEFRIYWLCEGFIVILNSYTGECRETGITREENGKVMFSPDLEKELHKRLWERAQPWIIK
jgi:hypothetical protein